MTMTFNNGPPQSVTLRIPRDLAGRLFSRSRAYVQDRWTFKRATSPVASATTISSAASTTARLPPSRWNPEQFFPGFKVQNWKDISPRLGVAYDCSATARRRSRQRRALCGVESVGPRVANNPQNTIGAHRHADLDRSQRRLHIYNPDGSVQFNELGPTSNANFGKLIPTTTTRIRGRSTAGTPAAPPRMAGGGAAPVSPRSGGERRLLLPLASATRRPPTTRSITAADFDGPFCISAPSHADLPGGGGYQVCGLYDIKSRAPAGAKQHHLRAKLRRHHGSLKGVRPRLDRREWPATPVSQGGVNVQRAPVRSCNTFRSTARRRGSATVHAVPARLQVSRLSHTLP